MGCRFAQVCRRRNEGYRRIKWDMFAPCQVLRARARARAWAHCTIMESRCEHSWRRGQRQRMVTILARTCTLGVGASAHLAQIETDKARVRST